MKIKNDNNLVGSILELSYSKEPTPNFIIIPISVYNIIESNVEFKTSIDSELSFPYKIGYLRGFELYLDIHLPPDKIIISWNKQELRNSKIESILGESNQLNDIEIIIH